MSNHLDLGHIRRAGETAEIVFHRRLARPIEKVWAALTVPERLADWFADVEFLDLRMGGAIRLNFAHADHRFQGTIVAYDPPRRIAWTWPKADGSQSTVTFELQPDGQNCRLTLTETGLAWSDGAGNGAGWHAHLQAIEDACDGVRTPWARLAEREQVVSGAYRAMAPA
jgi:uncharacterized protein YndB with AHSA1/START domain